MNLQKISSGSGYLRFCLQLLVLLLFDSVFGPPLLTVVAMSRDGAHCGERLIAKGRSRRSKDTGYGDQGEIVARSVSGHLGYRVKTSSGGRDSAEET